MKDTFLGSIEHLLGENVSQSVAITNSLSGRNYFRVTTPKREVIVSQTPLAQKAEFDNCLAIHPLLARGGVRVPQLLAIDAENLLLVQEDFGSTSLADKTKQNLNQPDLNLYGKAFDQLVTMQGITETVPVMVERTFDEQGILNEYDWVIRRFLVNGFLDQSLNQDQLDQLEEFYSQIAEAIGAHPRVFCHRDFQAPNIMVKGNEVGVIDFQGARLASPLYDLVSLLEDVNSPLSPSAKNHLKTLYQSKAQTAGVSLPPDFNEGYRWVFIQRRLQNASVFVKASRPGDIQPWKGHLDMCLAELNIMLKPEGINLS